MAQPAWVNFRHTVEYLAARIGAMSLVSLDLDRAFRGAESVGSFWYRIDPKHRRRARDNLRMAFPDWSEKQIRQTTEASMQELIKLVIEVFTLPRLLTTSNWPDRIKFDGIGPAIRLMNTGRPALLLTGHMGNWEAMGLLLALLGYPVHAIARPMNNRAVNQWLIQARMSTGLKIINKNEAESERMIRGLNEGGMLGIVGDQNGGAKGVFVPFFGRLASTHKSIGVLAVSKNLPVICGAALRTDGGLGRFRIHPPEIIMPEDWADQPDPAYYVTARFMHSLEMQIRTQPAQYLWIHRRWKSRPRHEELGKPIPAVLRRKLEALPWMDDALIRRLESPARQQQQS